MPSAFQQERLFHALLRVADHAVIQSCSQHPILPSELRRIWTLSCFHAGCCWKAMTPNRDTERIAPGALAWPRQEFPGV